MRFLDFLNENSGAITTIATLFLVGITFWYVWLTRKILKVASTPNVQILLLKKTLFPELHSINFCIQNIGTGFAYDLQFDGPITTFKIQQPIVLPFPTETLGEYGIIENGISHLGPGKRYEIPLIWWSSNQKYNLPEIPMGPTEPSSICITYKDPGKLARVNKEFQLDFTEVTGVTETGDPVIESIDFSLLRIVSTLQDMREDMKNEKSDSNNTQE